MVSYARLSAESPVQKPVFLSDLHTGVTVPTHGFEIFTDTISGTKFNRPGLEEALSYMREGDCRL
ncbi:recombinase family protein [Marinithermofilum abyssi]|uniref:recombinase family protein n=1 Tax=Marinithermofilum abyssi TaxID=1571185 RepID=UPI00227BF026|nr:recombinase family protein [Marinithermofilum abyssi]